MLSGCDMKCSGTQNAEIDVQTRFVISLYREYSANAAEIALMCVLRRDRPTSRSDEMTSNARRNAEKLGLVARNFNNRPNVVGNAVPVTFVSR